MSPLTRAPPCLTHKRTDHGNWNEQMQRIRDPVHQTSSAATAWAATSTNTQPAMLLTLEQKWMQGASQADSPVCLLVVWLGPDPSGLDWILAPGIGSRLLPTHGATYIMQPQQFPPLRIRLYVTLEVNIVAFLDIIRRQSWAQAQRHQRWICKEKRKNMSISSQWNCGEKVLDIIDLRLPAKTAYFRKPIIAEEEIYSTFQWFR